MNPDQLWENHDGPVQAQAPEGVAEDPAEAEAIFTTLMGDKVEPRRVFIEQNALEAEPGHLRPQMSVSRDS